MISGFLFFYKIKAWNLDIYKQKLRKRFKSLFIPYILWIALCILQTEIFKFLGVLIKGKPISGLWQYIIDNGGIHLFWNSEIWGLNYTNWLGYPTPLSGPTLIPLWFVRDLLVVIIFTPIIHYVIKKFNIIPIIVLGLCYISGIFIRLDGFSANCFFWFSLGAYFSIKNMVNCIQKIRIPAYIIAICSLLPLIWLNGRKGDGITMNPISNVLYYIYVISAVFSAVSITAVLLRNKKIKVNTTLTKTTFFIFLSHIFILMYVTTLLDKIITPETNYLLQTFSYLVKPILTVIICIAIYKVLHKFFPKILSVLVGNRL